MYAARPPARKGGKSRKRRTLHELRRVAANALRLNAAAVRAWGRAGFVEVSRHPPDDEHTAEWVLMRFAE
jgi:hypothetical protein